MVSVEARRSDRSRLNLWFRLAGGSNLKLSHEGSELTKARRDELWRHTCCEVFIRTRTGYYEFNLAPSGDWATYHFTGYREGMSRPDLAPVKASAHRHGDWWQLQAHLDLEALPDLADDVPWVLGVSAVLEMKDGSKSYWALAHPSDKPDFQHSDSFVLDLP